MFIDGLKLMVIGMGSVFFFLTVMVIVISLAARLLAPFANILEDTTIKKPDSGKNDRRAGDGNIVAAVIAAVHQYRRDREE